MASGTAAMKMEDEYQQIFSFDSSGHSIRGTEDQIILKSMEQIKPQIPSFFIKDITLRVYGMVVLEWRELDSFDDRNYYIQIDSNVSNRYIKYVHQPGYVLKVLNSKDSTTPGFIEAQHLFLQHLKLKGFPAQEPVQTTDGRNCSLETVPNESNSELNDPYVIHMMKYIQGDIVRNKPYAPTTLFNVGKSVGQLHNALKDFESSFYRNRDFDWSIHKLYRLNKFLYPTTDKTKRDLVNKIIAAFHQEVQPVLEHFRKGYIHGDLNQYNILVQDTRGQEYIPEDHRTSDVTAVIDFGDATYSYIIFDVAILIAHMSINCKYIDMLDAGGHLLAGYLSERSITIPEINALKLCICSRLAQVLVMSAHSYYLQPDNEYLLVHGNESWPILLKYWDTPSTDLLERWNSILDTYQLNKLEYI